MTRAYKLAVTIGGVMALSGCATLRSHDKPNTSNSATEKTIRFQKQNSANQTIDKKTASYQSGVDSLNRIVEAQALTLLETPITVKPMAMPITAFETYTLKHMKIKKINPLDSAAFTQNAQYERRSIGFFQDSLYRIPFLDCDEILYAADKAKADYVQIADQNKADQIIVTKELRDMVDTYKNAQKPEEKKGAKVYLSIQPESNAFRLPLSVKKAFGLRSNMPVAFVMMGFLQDYDAPQVVSTMRHEAGHEGIDKAHQDFLLKHAETRSVGSEMMQNKEQLLVFRRFGEYLADSTAFATANKNRGYEAIAASDMPDIRRIAAEHQELKAKAAYAVSGITSRNDSTGGLAEGLNYSDITPYYKAQRSFTAPPKFTHPTNAQRVKYFIIHQKRAEELTANGHSILYEQYGDLLPKAPIVQPYQPLVKRNVP